MIPSLITIHNSTVCDSGDRRRTLLKYTNKSSRDILCFYCSLYPWSLGEFPPQDSPFFVPKVLDNQRSWNQQTVYLILQNYRSEPRSVHLPPCSPLLFKVQLTRSALILGMRVCPKPVKSRIIPTQLCPCDLSGSLSKREFYLWMFFSQRQGVKEIK